MLAQTHSKGLIRMLTNLHYYSHYKPYIVGGDDADIRFKCERIAEHRQNISLAAENGLAPILVLNKALNDKVLKYLRSTAKTVIDIKYYSNMIDVDMRIFARNVPIYGLSPFKQTLCRSLDTFSICYNRAVKALSSQTHSSELKAFSAELIHTCTSNIDALSELGFGFVSRKEMFFDTGFFNESTKSQIFAAIKSTINIFNSVYVLSDAILEIPMMAHMNFRGFEYYYNYRITNRLEDTFKIIESGLLLDKAL